MAFENNMTTGIGLDRQENMTEEDRKLILAVLSKGDMGYTNKELMQVCDRYSLTQLIERLANGGLYFARALMKLKAEYKQLEDEVQRLRELSNQLSVKNRELSEKEVKQVHNKADNSIKVGVPVQSSTGRKKLTEIQKDAIVELYEKGKSQTWIANRLGISRSTVYNIIKSRQMSSEEIWKHLNMQ